ncbi:hypothetical protein F2Q70_00002507 [Brassica cretica]|uniref:Arabidopsis retrotransposon Orf1 C-terminal domain-containing protein n=1 Tax=Brassica cretica TaxID=69181 RepID=A0A8S9INF1_BRACR|nr:hypothetical protein F2Q70_00002507 [Brassica cretica]
MADGKFCSISLHDLNDMLEIADTPREVSVEKKFAPANAFWDLIAIGKFTSRKAYQTQIRNSTLRIIAKIVSNILFAKELTSKVTNGELQVLYTGLEDKIRRDKVIPIHEVKTNSGFLFISMLSERKDSLLRTEDKKDRCGSVLTPLFKRFNINLDSYTVVPELEYIDTAYLITCHILRDESTYKFADKEENPLYCKLPLPGLTNFMTLENIVFLPDAEHLCDDPRVPVPNENADMDDVEDVTPPADGAYDMGDLTDVTDDHAYRRWMVDSQKKNNSLMKKILRAITCGCIGSQDEQTTQGTRRPCKEPSGTSTGEERLPRNRRTAVEGQPININDPILLDYNCEGWDKESAARYNRLLAAEILRTRFTHAETLTDLGLESDVFETLDVMGLAPLCYQAQVLYPDLVWQVLATAQITYQNPTAPTYENCSFFMADGKFCSISLHDLNELLEIADTPREVSVEKKFAPANAFWDLIATGKFTSRKAYQSQIRNPTLRIIAKIVSNILFSKELTSKVTNGELQDSLLRTEDKKDRCGSVLTPLFKRFNINLDSYKVVPELEYIDTAYLITCHILRDESTYKFADKEGNTLYCKLPLPGLTNFTTLENIVFLPDAEHLCDDPRAPVPNENADMDDVEDVTPPAQSVNPKNLRMPPRTRISKPLKASRGAATPSHSASVPSTYPWPNKVEGQPININDPILLDYNCEGWDKESAARYNRLLAAEILPTRFTHAETLTDLGLESDVFETLDVMGLAPLCYQAQVLYPDLVRQVLATAQITYQNPTAPTYENCSFFFMANGKSCSISLHDLNELLEIADTSREVSVEKKFAPANAFWDLIATGKFTSRKAYQSQIQNPTLRIIAKIVSNILFAKELTSKVTNEELQVLYTGFKDEIRRDRVIPIQAVKTNPGFLLISMLSERKDSLLRTEDKKDRCGSVLTPLFKRFNINLDSYKVVPELEYIDTLT